MDSTEDLLTVFAERDRLLHAARVETRRAETLARAMDRIYGSTDLDKGIVDALVLCCEATGSDQWFLLSTPAEGGIAVLASNDPVLYEARWPETCPVLSRALWVGDLRETGWANALPDRVRVYQSLLSTPVAVAFQPGFAIGFLSRTRAAHARDDSILVRRIGGLLKQALSSSQLVRRNAALTMVVDAVSGDLPPESRFLDRSFEALRQSFGRVVDWQGQIVSITNDLLSAPTSGSDAAIERALGRMGALSASERTYVFRLRNGDRLDNTHEWIAPGIEPMIAHLQDMPSDLLSDYLPEMEAGRVVQITDVEALPAGSTVRDVLEKQRIRALLLAPMLKNGRLAGFVGFDAVHKPRRFLPLETQLLQSVCSAIAAVIDRAEGEQRAESARQSLEATLLAMPFVMAELDLEGRQIARFQGSGQVAIFPEDLTIGQLPEDFLPHGFAALVRRIMQIVDRDGWTAGHEYQLTVRGEARTFAMSAAAKVLDGKKVGYVVATRDITQQIQDLRQLRRLGKIAELTSNLVVITDRSQSIEWVNPAFERRTGWTLDEVRGKQSQSLLATTQTNRVEVERIRDLLAAGQPARGELLLLTRSGEEFWASEDIQAMYGAAGALEGFVSVATDITELKESQMRALRDRALAMDATSDGIGITGASGHFVYMNPAYRAMFGFEADEDIRRVHWKDLYSPEVAERYLAEHKPTLQEYGVWRGELNGRHRNGRIVAQEVSLTRRDEGTIAVSRDITHRLHLDAERARLRESLQLAQSMETVAHLAGGLAHDLNNLVAVVAGSAILLREMCSGYPEATAGLNRILRASETATDLVAGLSRLGRPQRQRSSQDLRKVVTEAIDLLGSQRIHTHNVTAQLPDAVCPVWANVTELLQVVLNLMLNACQADESDANIVTLSVTRDADDLPTTTPDVGELNPNLPYSSFRIGDTGGGIDPATRPRLFERYFTTKGSNGTGLGLPIVAGLLRDNGAALWFNSTPGLGTTVIVAWLQDDTSERQVPTVRATPDTPSSLAGHRILVVDDLPDVADMLSEMLETADAVCIAVSDPQEARELLTENPGLWSVLVTDQDMPGLRGSDLARAAMGCDPAIATVLVTAMPDGIGADRKLFHSILAKPITAQMLIAAVGRAIADHPLPSKDSGGPDPSGA